MLFLLLLACATESSENKEVSSNSDISTEMLPETDDGNDESIEQSIEKDINTASEPENVEKQSNANPISELPPEVLATMTEKEKQVYYAMVFQKNEMPTNKTLYDEEYPLLTPDRDLYFPPKRKSLIKETQVKKTFSTEGFSETFFFDSYNSQIYGLIRQSPNTPIQAKGDMIVLADGWKGSVRWHPRSLSQCILEFQIPVQSLTLDPISLRTEIGYLKHPYEWHTSWLQDLIITERQIDIKDNPIISFYSTQCTENAEKKTKPLQEDEKTHHILFHGYLKMNGVERRIKIKSTITERIKIKDKNIAQENTEPKNTEPHNYISELEISGIFHFNHSDFNITPYSNPFLLVNNDDLITVHYKLINSNE